MSYAESFIEKLAQLDQGREPFVAVTMVDAVGSTPQDVGSKMLVDAGGLVFGTVGGGRIERKAIEHAQAILQNPSSLAPAQLVEWNLQNDVGMTCGGVVRLFFEGYNLRTWQIVVFGAGHVAQSLVRCLLTLDCHIVCIDSRREWLARMPESHRLSTVHCEDPPAQVDDLRDSDFVVCMTMGHRTDRPILERMFQLGRVFSFLGVIGSHAKRKVLVRELMSAGIPAEHAEQFECPMGLPLGNNQPNEIAISVAARLIQRRDELRAETKGPLHVT